MGFDAKQNEALAAKLSIANVKTREMAGRKMSYVEGWHVIAEANRIFGFDGWSSETVMLQETNRDLVDLAGSRGPCQQWRIGYIAKVRVTAGGVSREGTGYGSGMGKPEAVGDAVEGAIKEAETDARKRALMTFGSPFGLALYDKEQNEVEPAQKQQQAIHTPAAPAQAPAPAPTKPRMTPAEWAENAGRELLDCRTKVALTAWIQKNSAAVDKLHDTDKALYNAINQKIANRSSELERAA